MRYSDSYSTAAPGSVLRVSPSHSLIVSKSPCLTVSPSSPAFSLAESLFAMAILSFTLLTLIGMLPSSLSSLKLAERRIAEARIVRSLATEYEIKTWLELTQTIGQEETRFYDISGLKTERGDVDVAFAARINVLPAGTILAEPSPNFIRRLHIEITDTPMNLGSLNDAKNLANRDFSVLLLCREDNREVP